MLAEIGRHALWSVEAAHCRTHHAGEQGRTLAWSDSFPDSWPFRVTRSFARSTVMSGTGGRTLSRDMMARRRSRRSRNQFTSSAPATGTSLYRQLALFAIGTARNEIVAGANVTCPEPVGTPVSGGIPSSVPSFNSVPFSCT
jgi:hypothetical protein